MRAMGPLRRAGLRGSAIVFGARKGQLRAETPVTDEQVLLIWAIAGVILFAAVMILAKLLQYGPVLLP